MRGLTAVFGMGTGVSLSPWAPTFAFVSRLACFRAKLETPPSLLVNYGVSYATLSYRCTLSTALRELATS